MLIKIKTKTEGNLNRTTVRSACKTLRGLNGVRDSGADMHMLVGQRRGTLQKVDHQVEATG